MTETPELPEQPLPETSSQVMVTTVSDPADDQRLRIILRRLTSHEAEYEASDVEHLAALKRALVSGEKRPEALSAVLRWCCCANDDDSLARMALEAGADPNGANPQYETAPLHIALASATYCPRVAKLLLDAHANPNAMARYTPQKKGNSWIERTPLDLAISKLNPEIIQVLLDAGADFTVVRASEGVNYDAMQVHGTQPALDAAVWLSQPPGATIPPGVQVLLGRINQEKGKNTQVSNLCLKKVEYAMKRGKRERLR